ncbi:MAG: hypothetical protein JWN75_798 [Candidatus Saccharibacteria bacterium]|nr:hypothetical protein [Candidatus Saccharibacteria bacterium]
MIIQIILVAVLIFLIVGFLKSRTTSRTKAYKKILLILFVVSAIVVVIFPDITTYVAHFLGIGRGADLLLYGITVVMIFVLLNNYIKDREEQKRFVILSRKVAILEAEIENKK